MNESDGHESAQEAQLDELLADCLRRMDAGETIDVQRLAEQHPQYAEELIELLQTAERIERMAGPRFDEDTVGAAVKEETRDETLRLPDDSSGRIADTAIFLDPTQVDAGGMGPPEGSTPPVRVALPRMFGDYELLQELGRGGMGVVYKARQVTLDRLVAVKMIIAGQLAGEEDLGRFQAEARTAGRMDHAGIVSIHLVGQLDGQPFYVMDYIDGKSLHALAGEGPIEPRRAAGIVREIALAVQYAHDHGVLHRDLKPANVLIDASDSPHITDFGLAKEINRDSGLTSTGAVLGTPSYMSPEQAAGKTAEVGRATDVYGLGGILYECLTGRPPFRRDTTVDTIMAVIHHDPEEPSELNSDVDRDLQTVCLKCLRKEPQERYASADDVAQEMQRYLDGHPVKARPRGRLFRLWHWTRNIPLVAALTGRKFAGSTVGHHRAQKWIVGLTCAVLLLAAIWSLLPETMPRIVYYASGPQGGLYHEVGGALAKRLQEIEETSLQQIDSTGSTDNFRLLKTNQVDWALLQADTMATAPGMAGAPLYFEKVYVAVRRKVCDQRNLKSAADLANCRMTIGPPGSGSHNSALRILQQLGLDIDELDFSEVLFGELLTDAALEGGFITTGPGHKELQRVLDSGEFVLLPIPYTDGMFEDQTFRPAHIRLDDVPKGMSKNGFPSEGIPTIGTPTFLAFSPQASSMVVQRTLKALYDGDLVTRYRLIAREQAAKDVGRWALHPAAREFFDSVNNGAGESEAAP